MFGAIYIGMSGLNAYSRGLQQVSNNVTNLNTSGFRGSIVSFDNFYSSGGSGGLSYGSGDNGSGGGIGLGESRLDMRAGELRQTNRDLDLGIDGAGFLVLMHGDEILYTRTGSFEVDKQGFIVLSGTEYRLATLDSTNQPVALSIDSMRTNAPKATTTVKLADMLSLPPNLGADATPATHTMNQITVYDESGAAHNWRIKFTRADDSTTVTSTEVNVQVFDEKDTDVTSTAGAQVIKFDLTGHVDSSTKTLSFTKSGITATIDFSDVDLWSGTTTIRAASIDGRASGTITKIAVNAKGEIELGYSNEEKAALGAVALADFRDPQALQQRSGGLFSYEGTDREFLASEDPRVGKAMSGRLEASNVDLSQQFGELILIQRGFQASSQIVSVSNDMIQQLFGIRGQG